MPWLPQDAIQLGAILVGNGDAFAREVEVRAEPSDKCDPPHVPHAVHQACEKEELAEVVGHGSMEEVLPCREIAAAGFGLFA